MSTEKLEITKLQWPFLKNRNNQFENLQNILNSKTKQGIEDLEKEIKDQENKIELIKEQYTAVVDAEKQLHQHLKLAISDKNEDIKDKTQKLFIERRISHLEEELKAVQEEIRESSELHKQKLNETFVIDKDDSMSGLEDNSKLSFEDANQELLEEELVLRQRFEGLKNAKNQLKTEINPNIKNMEDERTQLEKEIELLKIEIEGQYYKYNEIRQGIEIVKEKLSYEKESEISSQKFGSFVDTREEDDIDKEIKLMRENKKSENLDKSRSFQKSITVSISQSRKKRSEKENKLELPEETVQESKILKSEYTLSQFVSEQELNRYSSTETTEKLKSLIDGTIIYNPAKLKETGNNTRQRILCLSHDLKYILILTEKQSAKIKIDYRALTEVSLEFIESTNEGKVRTDSLFVQEAKESLTSLNKSLTNNRSYEKRIKIKDIVKIVIPPLTRDIVRIQKDDSNPLHGDKILSHKDIKIGKFIHKSKKYSDKQLFALAQKATEYPFTVLFKEAEINIVATSINDYRALVKAFRFIIDNKDKPYQKQPLTCIAKLVRKEFERIKEL